MPLLTSAGELDQAITEQSRLSRKSVPDFLRTQFTCGLKHGPTVCVGFSCRRLVAVPSHSIWRFFSEPTATFGAQMALFWKTLTF